MLLAQVKTGLGDAWAPVLATRLELAGRETNPHFVNLANSNDVVVVSRLRIDFDGKGGEIHITLPYTDARTAAGNPAHRHAG